MANKNPERIKWKTKGEGREYRMICQNSDPTNSKYPQAAPEGGCKEWVITGPETSAVLCSSCVQRLMSNSFSYKETVSDDE